MKFEGMTLHHFMRYKGKNQIIFSCSKKKNVTVVLGDNTAGKTTIAQAFRWCLYGALQTEREKTEKDYLLLNNEVLAAMDPDSRENVYVELAAFDEEKRYVIRREVQYTRAYPHMTAREFQKKLSLCIMDAGETENGMEVEEQKAEELINELFPRNLSHYFLFDGERWSDVKINGVRESIKESVHILTGLSAYQAAMWHLKDMGSNSVIRKFKAKISGTGNIYDNLKSDCKRIERQMESCREQIKNIQINILNNQNKTVQAEQYLEEHKSTEALQSRYRQLGVVRRAQKDRTLVNYKMLVNEFSGKAYMIFAQPMIKAALELVRSVEGERRDIPFMHQTTIDYIIKTGTCICGTPISQNSQELECLLEQRRYLPPADIGSLLGTFERTGKAWNNRSDGACQELKELALKIDECVKEYEETCNEYSAMEKHMDEHVDFSEKRKQIRRYQDEIRQLSLQEGNMKGQMEALLRQKNNIENEMKGQEEKSEENKKWNSRAALAEQLYQKMHQDFSLQEQKVFQQLNCEIQQNFERMFNARDKKIQLTEQYEIQMMYRTEVGYREEKNLSEGEKIARNFAFIVTIMDYSRRKKAERQEGSQESNTLPIVLDGPFSKLGDENIELIAGVLPEVSEQVIIFMLKKDWRYTNLESFVGASYCIEKEADKSSATIKRMEGEKEAEESLSAKSKEEAGSNGRV